MQSIKEKKILIKFAQSMGQPVDPLMLEEVQKYEEMQQRIQESVRGSFDHVFDGLPAIVESPKLDIEPVSEKKEEIQPPLHEDAPRTEQPAEESLADRAAKAIKVPIKEEDSYQQPSVQAPADIKAIKDKLKFLEQWVGKISLTGPGGGAGDVINLTHPVRLVTSNYTITRKDYYIGVNSPSSVTITLSNDIGFPGRKIVIKDESGNCASNPITVLGTVDNDPGGFILQMNNGGIQMIYREGWRII